MTRKSRQRDHSIRCSHRRDLLSALKLGFSKSVFAALLPRADVRWTPLHLALAAVLMSWMPQATLTSRFDAVRTALRQLFPGRRAVGRTYQSFVLMLRRWGPAMLRLLEDHLRTTMRVLLKSRWLMEEAGGWLVFAVDGTKMDLPRVAALEKAFGAAGKAKCHPQALLTSLLHLASGVMWGYRVGPADASERGHLRFMLSLLPIGSMLVADAGFVGYELLKALAGAPGSERFFLIRAGSNVRLLHDLGWAVERRGRTYYLWPDTQRRAGCEPLRLRLIKLTGDNGKSMHLLTNVYNHQRLSDKQAQAIYHQRWGIEVCYRTLKDTMGRRKMLSRSPVMAALELRWTMIGLWLLQLLNAKALIDAKKDPRRMSVARALEVTHALLREPNRRLRRGDGLLPRLRRAVQDDYQRKSSKQARDWPHKKRTKPPGEPKLHQATPEQIAQAKGFEANFGYL